MLNYLWSFMILTGIVYAAFTGRMPDITNAALDSSKEAISLCITMIGVMSFWVGLMEIASKAGIIPAASRKIRPVIRFLFPNLPAGHPAEEPITTNMIANILGLGWAATPAGLKAMEELSKLEEQRRKHLAPGISRPAGTASNETVSYTHLDVYKRQPAFSRHLTSHIFLPACGFSGAYSSHRCRLFWCNSPDSCAAVCSSGTAYNPVSHRSCTHAVHPVIRISLHFQGRN